MHAICLLLLCLNSNAFSLCLLNLSISKRMFTCVLLHASSLDLSDQYVLTNLRICTSLPSGLLQRKRIYIIVMKFIRIPPLHSKESNKITKGTTKTRTWDFIKLNITIPQNACFSPLPFVKLKNLTYIPTVPKAPCPKWTFCFLYKYLKPEKSKIITSNLVRVILIQM